MKNSIKNLGGGGLGWGHGGFERRIEIFVKLKKMVGGGRVGVGGQGGCVRRI